jgi:tRNA(fMet)-specific endonuclease VapC
LAGTPIGGNDLIIAALAETLDLTLVSDNDREFARPQCGKCNAGSVHA